MFEDIKIDEKANEKLTPDGIEKLKGSVKKSFDKHGDFKMKTIFTPHRQFVKDFYKFNTDLKNEVYNKIKTEKILIVDDYWTTGSTLIEINRILKEFGATQEIVSFVLLDSK